jgi:alpha-galactosidase
VHLHCRLRRPQAEGGNRRQRVGWGYRLQVARALVFLGLVTSSAYGQSWTIGNARIERTITFSARDGLRTTRLTNLDTHFHLIAASEQPQSYASEFAFDCDGQNLSGSSRSFQLVNSVVKPVAGGTMLTITLRAVSLPLLVDVVYRVYDGQPAIRKWLVLHNTGAATLRISHLKLESIAPSIGPSSETVLNAEYGAVPRELLYTGRSEDAALLISNARTGDGFALLNEVPGYMKRTEVDGFYHPGHAFVTAMYDTDLMPFERDVKPNEVFQTAAVSLLAFRVGAGFFDPHWVLPTYAHSVLQRRIANAGAPWIYNTWNPFRRNIDAKTTLELVDVAGSMGMDIFTIDDGWQKEYGENAIDLEKFPDGLEPIREAVEARGMRLGLWLPLATIGEETADYRDHPEWLALDHAGKPKQTYTAAGSKVVMCLASLYEDAAAARINDAIERFHLAYVKLDLTTVFNAYGESPGCWPKDHSFDGWSQSLGLIYEGIRHVTAQIYARHPEVLIDLTFELWGQKHVIDAGLLDAGDLDWLSNVNDAEPDAAGPRQARMLLYHRAISMPADAMLIGNLQANMPNPAEVFATVVGSAPLLLGDLRKLSASDRSWYREHILWFKELRAKSSLSDSFFPLGSWQQPRADAWDGFARISYAGTGIITIFRNESGAASVDVKLPLLPKGNYRIHSAMTHRDLGIVSDRDWSQGISVPFEPLQKVEILEVRMEH